MEAEKKGLETELASAPSRAFLASYTPLFRTTKVHFCNTEKREYFFRMVFLSDLYRSRQKFLKK